MSQRRVRDGCKSIVLGVFLLFVFGPHIANGKAGKAINSYAGKYIVYADTFYMCDSESLWDWNFRVSHWNPAKPNELQRLTGWFNATVHSLTDASWVNVVLDVRANNMWKENAFVFKFPNMACTSVKKQIPEFWNVVLKLPRNEKVCRIPPKLYELHDEPIAWFFPSFPVMPYGNYRFRLTMGPPGKPAMSCLAAECHIVPKMS
ncbi:uncharacterized protein LOC117643634 isoform X1 [Thrips palmi]|uniref:Uncharacterized protein LOC117643634 isoform X1 n=1 Tax=Thrips palmi TaxID=161013 RepID=A0A6P8ZLA6_THRPL|nr:uncharacterized protein LOC117643634 isoform X1 [Thrips palmi]